MSSYLKFMSKLSLRHKIYSKCKGTRLHICPLTTSGPWLSTNVVLWKCWYGMAFSPLSSLWPLPVTSLNVGSRNYCPRESENKKVMGKKMWDLSTRIFSPQFRRVWDIFLPLSFVLPAEKPLTQWNERNRMEWNHKNCISNIYISLTTHIFQSVCIYAMITTVYLFKLPSTAWPVRYKQDSVKVKHRCVKVAS